MNNLIELPYLCVSFQESVDSLWLTELSKMEKRRTSSLSTEIINPTNQWQDKERILNKDELDLGRVSMFGVSF